MLESLRKQGFWMNAVSTTILVGGQGIIILSTKEIQKCQALSSGIYRGSSVVIEVFVDEGYAGLTFPSHFPVS